MQTSVGLLQRSCGVIGVVCLISLLVRVRDVLDGAMVAFKIA